MNDAKLLQSDDSTSTHGYLQTVFGIDLRSLALFRVVIAVIVLIDLCWRWQSLTAMYTDDGYFTRDLADLYYRMVSGTEAFSYWSVHKLSGSVEFQGFLFILTGFFAGMLLLGYHTRIASVALWVLVASMQARNPLINTSGDMLLKMLLFWSMFLPLSAVWSLDNFRKRYMGFRAKRNFHFASVATAGIILQLCYMYFFTGLAKCNDVWYRGDALHYVLHLDIYTKDFAKVLASNTLMMRLASWATLVSELFFPFLLLLPFFNSKFRWLNIITFWIFHLMIFMSMEIGLFSVVSMTGWIPLIPKSFWNFPIINNVASLLNRIFSGRRKLDENAKINFGVARQLIGWKRGQRLLANIVCLFFISYFLCWNLGNINRNFMPRPFSILGASLNLDQHFQMFGIPPKQSPWFTYDADLVNGERVDIFRDQPFSDERPESVRRAMPNHHFRKLHRNLARHSEYFTPFREPLVKYYAEKWNREHDADHQIKFLKVTCFLDEIGPFSSYGDQVTQTWGQFGDPNARLFDKVFEEALGGDGMPF